MGLELPGWLTEPLSWIGLTWPQADEEKLFAAGQEWMSFGMRLQSTSTTANDAATQVWTHNEGDAVQAFQKWWTKDDGPQERMLEDIIAAMVIGAALVIFAVVTLALKIAFIVQLITLAIAVAQAIATAFATFGATTAEVPGFIAATRAICRQLIKQVVKHVTTVIKDIFKKAKALLKKVAQRRAGRKLAREADRKVLQQIERDLAKVNKKFDPKNPGTSMNCTHCVQTYELRRRGLDVEATELPPQFHPYGGRPLAHISGPWGRNFTPGGKTAIEDAFVKSGPGSRGVVYVQWKEGGAHVFNVENVGGKVRFIDGQNNAVNVSNYFRNGMNTSYVRLDDLPTPPGTIPHFAT